MEFEASVSHLREAVSRVFDVAPSKTQDGATVGVKITATDDGFVSFIVNDTTIVATAKFPASVTEAGTSVVALSTLFKALTGFNLMKEGSGTSTIRLKKGSQSLYIVATTIYNKKSVKQRRVISFLDTSISDLQIISSNLFVSVPDSILLEGLRHVMVSADGGGPESKGILISFDAKKLRVVSMSGVSLTEYRGPCDVSPEYKECVIDGAFVSKLVKILSKIVKENESQDIRLLLTDRMFIFEIDGFMVGSSVLISSYPDYGSLVSSTRKSFILDKEIFLDNLRNIMYNSDKEDDFRVSLKFFDGQLVVATQSCENEGIPLEGEGEGNLHIDFNIFILESCIRNVPTKYVGLSYKDRKSPIIISPQGEELDYSLFTILAPLK